MLESIAAAVLFLLPVVPAAQEKPPPAPQDAARVKEVIAALDRAFAAGKAEDRRRAIEAAASVVHAEVIAAVAKGLRDRDALVRGASIGSLRFMPHPDALEALHELARRDREIEKDEILYPELVRAIGQHASDTSIALLADKPLGVLPMKSDKYRVLSIGNIRSPKSVEALFQLMQTLGKFRARPYMEEFRLSLAALTGADRGESHEAWIAWWNDHKKKIEVPRERPELPAAMEVKWRVFWNSAEANRKSIQRAFGDKGAESGGQGGQGGS